MKDMHPEDGVSLLDFRQLIMWKVMLKIYCES